MTKKEQLDLRIEAKLIGKMANHRIMIRDLFKKRHIASASALISGQCMYHVNELRMWQRLNEITNKDKNKFHHLDVTIPYETYYAKQLTK